MHTCCQYSNPGLFTKHGLQHWYLQSVVLRSLRTDRSLRTKIDTDELIARTYTNTQNRRKPRMQNKTLYIQASGGAWTRGVTRLVHVVINNFSTLFDPGYERAEEVARGVGTRTFKDRRQSQAPQCTVYRQTLTFYIVIL